MFCAWTRSPLWKPVRPVPPPLSRYWAGTENSSSTSYIRPETMWSNVFSVINCSLLFWLRHISRQQLLTSSSILSFDWPVYFRKRHRKLATVLNEYNIHHDRSIFAVTRLLFDSCLLVLFVNLHEALCESLCEKCCFVNTISLASLAHLWYLFEGRLTDWWTGAGVGPILSSPQGEHVCWQQTPGLLD